MSHLTITGNFPQFRPPNFAGLGLYVKQGDGSIFELSSSGNTYSTSGFAGFDAFIGWSVDPSITYFIPNGDAVIPYGYLKTTNTLYGYSDDGSPATAADYTTSLTGPTFLSVSQTIEHDSVNDIDYISLASLTLPGDDTPLAGWVGGDPPATASAAIFGGVQDYLPSLFGVPVGAFLADSSGFPNANGQIVYVFANSLFPAFDMSDGWYATITTTSIIGGVTTTTSRSSPTLFIDGAGNYPSNEYTPKPGYTLTSQTSSTRVWTKGSDTITIALSAPATRLTPSDWAADGDPVINVRAGQALIYGTSTVTVYNGLGSLTALSNSWNPTTHMLDQTFTTTVPVSNGYLFGVDLSNPDSPVTAIEPVATTGTLTPDGNTVSEPRKLFYQSGIAWDFYIGDGRFTLMASV